MDEKFLLYIDNKINKRKHIYVASIFVIGIVIIFTLLHSEWALFPEFSATETTTQPLNLPQPPLTTTEETSPLHQHDITISQGMNLAAIFKTLNLPYQLLHEILSLDEQTAVLKNLRPKEKINFLLDSTGTLVQLTYFATNNSILSIQKTENGYKAETIRNQLEKRVRHITGTINGSFVRSGVHAGLPEKIMIEASKLLSWEVNLSKDIKRGDKFSIIHEDLYNGDERTGSGQLIAVSLVSRGKTYQAIRYTDPDGMTDYYKADGTSLNKPFLKAPVTYARISSRFNEKRYHPILHSLRLHKGIDYVAPTGTPVKSIGDGRISFVGRKGGYGKTIIVDHGSQMSSLYAHLSQYNKKLRQGAKVRKGEIIGYVGSSGHATGAHLHHEIRLANKPVNPESAKLPTSKKLPSKYIADFLNQTKPLLAKLEAFKETKEEIA